jgi:hypothetical protein
MGGDLCIVEVVHLLGASAGHGLFNRDARLGAALGERTYRGDFIEAMTRLEIILAIYFGRILGAEITEEGTFGLAESTSRGPSLLIRTTTLSDVDRTAQFERAFARLARATSAIRHADPDMPPAPFSLVAMFAERRPRERYRSPWANMPPTRMYVLEEENVSLQQQLNIMAAVACPTRSPCHPSLPAEGK